MNQYEAKSATQRVTLEALNYLGQWRVRLVATEQDEDGEYTEPFVLTLEFRTLDFAGQSWQALAVLDEVVKHLHAALVDGYE